VMTAVRIARGWAATAVGAHADPLVGYAGNWAWRRDVAAQQYIHDGDDLNVPLGIDRTMSDPGTKSLLCPKVLV